MATSSALRRTRKEVETLKKYFLPAKFDLTGVYSSPAKVQAHTRAFLVLAHAEVETYLESWAKDIAQAAESLWNGSNKISMPLAFLLITTGVRINSPSALTKDTPQRFSEECTALFGRYYKQIKDNHGVKEDNVLSLFSAVGTPTSAFGATLFPALNSFGTDRGHHAHHAARAVINTLDPETEYDRVVSLLKELETLDSWLQGYRKGIR